MIYVIEGVRGEGGRGGHGREGGAFGVKGGDGRSPSSFLCGIPARGEGTVEKKERERQSDIIDFDSSPYTIAHHPRALASLRSIESRLSHRYTHTSCTFIERGQTIDQRTRHHRQKGSFFRVSFQSPISERQRTEHPKARAKASRGVELDPGYRTKATAPRSSFAVILGEGNWREFRENNTPPPPKKKG